MHLYPVRWNRNVEIREKLKLDNTVAEITTYGKRW
jgi:hypothetical protein